MIRKNEKATEFRDIKRNRFPKYDRKHGTATAFIRYGKETKKRQGSEIFQEYEKDMKVAPLEPSESFMRCQFT
jgi:hypothetical protein